MKRLYKSENFDISLSWNIPRVEGVPHVSETERYSRRVCFVCLFESFVFVTLLKFKYVFSIFFSEILDVKSQLIKILNFFQTFIKIMV